MTVKAIIADLGGAVAIAKALDVDRTTVLDWVRRNAIPAGRVVQIHRKYGTSLDVLLAPVAVPRLKKSTGSNVGQANVA